MFNKIMHNQQLWSIMCHDCSENNASVAFDNSLLINGFLNNEKILILKPDNYYNTKNFATPPKSPDCLILISHAQKARYDLYLVELRNVTSSSGLKPKDIIEKFETMVNQFFPEFSTIFYLSKYKKISFYLVTTYPKGGSELSPEEYRTKIKGSVLDILGSAKPLKLFGRAILIQPAPSPFKITTC
jgi:hypothetical protein